MEGNGGTATPAWDLGMHWAPAAGSGYPPDPSFAPRAGGGGGPSRHDNHQQQERQAAWLNLGKRPCWTAGWQPSWDNGGTAGGTAAAESKRKEKAAAAAVPRCVVEGCHVSLAGSKEYHRRHKVCEAHSKAPRVVVLGTEQRFCQQCSRFHAISEFDDTKRSCRRRLAGHNERRRKSNASEAMARSAGHPHGVIMPFLHGGFPSSQAGALSLLSSARGGAPWLIPAAADISARSSAALDELIAENRAALLAWQYFSDRSSPATSRVPLSSSPPPTGREVPFGWHTPTPPQQLQDRFEAGHTTLDLMQTPGGAPSAGALFRPVPERPPKNDGDAGDSSVA